MAQTGYTPISLYYTTTASAAPTAGNLVAGELAINTNDGVLYYKDSSGVVQSIASKVTNSGSFTNLAYTGTLTGGTGVVNLGSGQFYKDASGNVGIGTSSPAFKLDINGGGSGVANINGTGSGPYMRWQVSGTAFAYLGSGAQLGAGNSNDFCINSQNSTTFATGSSNLERMRIDSSGNVGIGTTSSTTRLGFGAYIPANGQTINVYEASNIKSGLGIVSGVFRVYTDSSSAMSFGQVSTSDGSTYTERMRIDSSGNVTIGATTSFSKFGVSTTNGNLGLTGGNTSGGSKIQAFGATATSDGYLAIEGYTKEYMRIDSSGNALFGLTASIGGGLGGIVQSYQTTAGYYAYSAKSTASAGNTYFHNFLLSTGSQVGYIYYNGAVTIYSTSSDARLKENIVDSPSALNDLNEIKIRSFDWIENNIHQKYGVIAQELQTIAPEAIATPPEKDGMLGVDYSLLVPMMIKSIQELNAKVDAQANTIESMQSKLKDAGILGF